MNALPYPDRWHLNAAQGWLMLENPLEAEREFKKIDPRLHDLPDVMELRCRFLIAEENWTEAFSLSLQQLRISPERPASWIHHAYCLHESRRTREAAAILRVAARKFPRHRLIAFNLACYCCHLQNFRAALRWTNRAIALFDRSPAFFPSPD